MQSEGERISNVILHFCKSKAEFARLMQETPQTVSNWVSRGGGKSVFNKILSKFPNINANWLLTGEGEMLNSQEPLSSDATHTSWQSGDVYLITKSGMKYFRVDDSKYRMRVPLVPFNAYARYANESCSEVEQEREEWGEVEFLVNQIGHGSYMAFEIKGDSMDDDSRRSFIQGDIVLARELHKSHWKSGLHYKKHPFWIIVLDSTILCKQIVNQDLETGEITCHSLNPSPEYADFTVNLDQVCRIFNVVQRLPAAEF